MFFNNSIALKANEKFQKDSFKAKLKLVTSSLSFVGGQE